MYSICKSVATESKLYAWRRQFMLNVVKDLVWIDNSTCDSRSHDDG